MPYRHSHHHPHGHPHEVHGTGPAYVHHPPAGTNSNGFKMIVGTVVPREERAIHGRNGGHLQFDIHTGATGGVFQVDVNTFDRNGKPIEYFEVTSKENPSQTTPGVYSAQFSYLTAGLTDAEFKDVSESNIDQILDAALNASKLVAVYGMTFSDTNVSGIHETHFHPGPANEDGMVAVFDGEGNCHNFFFKFAGESLGR